MQESVHTVTKPIGFCCECRKISRGHKIKLVSGDFPVCDVRARSRYARYLMRDLWLMMMSSGCRVVPGGWRNRVLDEWRLALSDRSPPHRAAKQTRHRGQAEIFQTDCDVMMRRTFALAVDNEHIFCSTSTVTAYGSVLHLLSHSLYNFHQNAY